MRWPLLIALFLAGPITFCVGWLFSRWIRRDLIRANNRADRAYNKSRWQYYKSFGKHQTNPGREQGI